MELQEDCRLEKHTTEHKTFEKTDLHQNILFCILLYTIFT